MMTRNFLLGFFLGVSLAGAGWAVARLATSPASVRSGGGAQAKAMAEALARGQAHAPHWKLLPSDFSLAKVFDAPEALAVLEDAEVVTLHRVSSSAEGGVTMGGDHFDAGLTATRHDAAVLRKTFLAPNAYESPSACLFNPGVLIRFQRGADRLDLQVCFQCEEVLWALDGRSNSGPAMGLSPLGMASLRDVLRRVFPQDAAFQ